MFNTPAKIDYSVDEGTVTEVDAIRKLCKVKTISGQNLNSVRWLQPSGGASRGGDRPTPALGDQVLLHYGLGSPIILGFLPRLQSSENVFPTNIDGVDILVDTGNFSSGGDLVLGDQNSPKDMLAGDRLISSAGGGLLAILRGGSLLLRSSRLAEIFISKWDDVVRIVSRNFEHFTDLSSDVIKNFGGRLYRYSGYAASFEESKTEDYTYNQYFGDVALAEMGKTRPDLLSEEDTPEADDRLYKEQVTFGSGGESVELMYRELHQDGTHEIIVKNEDGTDFTRIRQDNTSVVLTYKDVNVIAIDPDQVSLSKAGINGTPVIVLNDDGIQAAFNSGSVVLSDLSVVSTFGIAKTTLDATQAKLSYGITGITSSVVTTIDGVHAEFGIAEADLTADSASITYGAASVELSIGSISINYGASDIEVTPAGIFISCGGHSVNVTAGGVAII